MPAALTIILAFAGGLLLGFIYFGGLRLTLKILPHTHRTMLLLSVSFLIRMVLLLLGFYLIMWHNWVRGLACIVGVILMRTVLLFFTEQPRNGHQMAKENRIGSRIETPVSADSAANVRGKKV